MFMEHDTKVKFKFFFRKDPPELLSMVHPSQLEKKFGGTADDVPYYWPPIMPSYEF
jgi:hypothetical protein